MHRTIPEWSGQLVLTHDGEQGMISVAYSDPRTPKAPAGMKLVDIIQDAEENSETYVYRRV